MISADSHVNEVDATWKQVQRKHGGRAPKIVWDPSADEPGPYLVIEEWKNSKGLNRESCVNEHFGLRFGGLAVHERKINQTALRKSAAVRDFKTHFKFEDFSAPGLDPASRMEDMKRDHVCAEILYASHLRHFAELGLGDKQFFQDICDSYNRWLMDYASYDRNHLYPLPFLNLFDPVRSASEIREYVRDGAKGFMIVASVPSPLTFGDADFDPIWNAACDTGVPISMHATTGQFRPAVYGHPETINVAGRQGEIINSISEMIFGGVFDRFPSLKIISAEWNIGWVPYTLQRLESNSTDSPAKRPPADYLSDNVYFTFENDRAGLLGIEIFGEDNYLWASDYPHSVTTWPDSAAIVDKQFEGISETVKRKVTRDNAIKLYGLTV